MTAKNIVLALGDDRLNLALQSLAMRLEANRAELIEMVVCDGSALILGDDTRCIR